MSIAYLDPGNIESDLQSGSVAQYRYLFLYKVPASHRSGLSGPVQISFSILPVPGTGKP